MWHDDYIGGWRRVWAMETRKAEAVGLGRSYALDRYSLKYINES